MSARIAIRSLGLAARPFLKPFTASAPAPTFLNASALHMRLQSTRLYSSVSDKDANHGIAHVPAPWRVSDLKSEEREAFEKYGPNYLEFVGNRFKRQAMRTAERRAKQTEFYETNLGPNWYSIMKEGERRFAEVEQKYMDTFMADNKLERWEDRDDKAWHMWRKQQRYQMMLQVKEQQQQSA